jgi:hypothetical protein
MTRQERLRRVALVCSHCTRNLAYYRAGWAGKNLVTASTQFWRTVNGNCLDQCVLEWCKLFGDKRGEHFWGEIVSDATAFETRMLQHVGIGANDFKKQVDEIRRYRDKFVAHLDSDHVMSIPKLDVAKASVRFYHSHLVSTEAQAGDLGGLLCTELDLFYKQCADEAEAVYRANV